ncbi:hypothetical protein KAI65_02605 [Candidatus Parcubacteria bacterium]|nr:hypothetical protein [Candidatus Parcubacteria bacterium]
MNINTQVSQPENFFDIRKNGWKYYNNIKKKAMEQEFSWAGLLLSMSIAFFIVIITAYSLTLLHTSFKNAQLEQTINQQIYSLKVSQDKSGKHYIQVDIIDLNKIDSANFSSFI